MAFPLPGENESAFSHILIAWFKLASPGLCLKFSAQNAIIGISHAFKLSFICFFSNFKSTSSLNLILTYVNHLFFQTFGHQDLYIFLNFLKLCRFTFIQKFKSIF